MIAFYIYSTCKVFDKFDGGVVHVGDGTASDTIVNSKIKAFHGNAFNCYNKSLKLSLIQVYS